MYSRSGGSVVCVYVCVIVYACVRVWGDEGIGYSFRVFVYVCMFVYMCLCVYVRAGR